MNNFKSILLLIIILIVVATVGYWAFATIEPGNVNVEKQKRAELEETNGTLKEEIEQLTKEVQSFKEKEVAREELEKEQPATVAPAPSLKYQSLINNLQKLIDDNISMKEKSTGSRVGAVQTFLNLYNKTNKRVDNDYGASTKKDVASFQKAVEMTADGEAGPNTFRKMIEWLKKQ